MSANTATAGDASAKVDYIRCIHLCLQSEKCSL